MSRFNEKEFIAAIGNPREWANCHVDVDLPTSSLNHGSANAIEITGEADIIKSGMSAADVAAAIERTLRPPIDANAVREGLRLDIDIITKRED